MTVNKNNNVITFQGKPLSIEGQALKEGSSMPSFVLTGQDMADLASASFAGKPLVLSVVPSLDTPVCSIQTKRFNQEAATLGNRVSILTVSMDLPFAQKRWCGAEGASNVRTASAYKYRDFGTAFGCFIKEWGLLCRAIFVIDAAGKVTYCEYVPEISAEPNYDAALKALSAVLESK